MQSTPPKLLPALKIFAPSLVIFDKDGTLIDFHAMWGHWMLELARQLEAESGLSISDQLFKVMDFAPDSGRIAADGHLAVTPTAGLRALTVQVMQAAGLSPQASEAAMSAVWRLPDALALSHPLADLKTLFNAFHVYGAKVAIATSDDRAMTEAMLAGLGIASLVDAVACADDGLAIKPEADMVLAICEELDISPAKTVMVGDNVVDLQMGRVAEVGLTIGVLSGLGAEIDLAPYADIVLSSIDELIEAG